MKEIEIELRRPSYEESYQKLMTAFVERLENSVAALDNILAQKQLHPVGKDDLERIMYLAHSLAGSGTTFGFPAVTEAGRKVDLFLERAVKTLDEEKKTLDDDSMKTLEGLLQGLRKACFTASQQKEKQKPGKPLDKIKSLSGDIKEVYHVLVVDDDEDVLDLLSLKLRQKGIRVTQARDGNSAVASLSREIPDLIVLDIMMPGISGHEILRRLKQDPGLVAVPVIMLTAQTAEKDVVSALHAGAIDYVVKPVDPDKLVARVERTLDAARYTIMIADNDHLILQLLDSKYRNRGFRVILSDDGKDAWNQILRTVPDLIILDRMMPGLDGLAVLKNIRDEDATRNIPVIVLSARKEDRDIQLGLQYGANDYIAKPFLPDDLMNRSLKLLKDRARK